MESTKGKKNSSESKEVEATAAVEKTTVSKKKKVKFVKIDLKGLNIFIDDGRGRDTEIKKDFQKSSNNFHSSKSQDSTSRKSGNHIAEYSNSSGRGRGSNRNSNSATTSTSSGRNMSRGKYTNHKADYEVNDEHPKKHNKKEKISNQFDSDKDFRNNNSDLMWEDTEIKKTQQSRSQWKKLETNKTRERLMNKSGSNGDAFSKAAESVDADSRNNTNSILDSSLYQNTYDSKSRNFEPVKLDEHQIFHSSSLQESATNSNGSNSLKISSTYSKDDKLFANETLYSPVTTSYSFSNTTTPSYAMTTASGNANNINNGVYSTNSFLAATTHGYSSITNSITNSQPQSTGNGFVQQPISSSYSTNTHYNFSQSQSPSTNTYQDTSALTSNTVYSQPNLYPQPNVSTYSQNNLASTHNTQSYTHVGALNSSYQYPHNSTAPSLTTSSTAPTTTATLSQKYLSHPHTASYQGHGIDMSKSHQNHLDTKPLGDSIKTSVDHLQYVGHVDYPNYVSQYQESVLKDAKADPIPHFEFRNTLDITPMIPMESYMTNYIQPAPPPQTNPDYINKMVYWNNVPMPNILHAPPPQPPHSAMYKYTSHIPYDMPTSQATQKPNYSIMKLNDSTPTTDPFISPTHMRMHQMPAHRYPVDNPNTNKLPMAYTEPQPPSFESPLSGYHQRYQNERHFTDFGNFQTPPSVQHSYQQSDSFGNNDMPTRIHQQPNSIHQYFKHNESSNETSSLRFQDGNSFQQRNKRAITGGGSNQQHFNNKSIQYPNNLPPHQFSKQQSYDDRDISEPPGPQVSNNIFSNSKYEHQFTPNMISSNEDKKTRSLANSTPITVVTSIITTTNTTSVSSTLSTSKPQNSDLENQSPLHDSGLDKQDVKGTATPPKISNPQISEKSNKVAGVEKHSHKSSGVKTIDFNQFQNNVMKNYPNKNYRAYSKSYNDKANKNEIRVTKIMQRPVDENKDEIAKLPISLGGDSLKEKVEESDNKENKENKINEKSAKTPNKFATSKPATVNENTKIKKGNKTSVSKNIQILSPTKKDEKKVASSGSDVTTQNDKIEKSEEKSIEKKDKTDSDTSKNKKEDGKENPVKQQKKKSNYFSKYSRGPHYNDKGYEMNDFHYVPMYDGNINKYNKFGGNNRYPNSRFYDSYDFIDPRQFFPGNSYNVHYGPSSLPMPMYNNYPKKDKQKKNDSNEKIKNTKQDLKNEDANSKKSNKKIKFKRPEIVNEDVEENSSKIEKEKAKPLPDTVPNPSGILKKSKNSEKCNFKEFKENIDKRIKEHQKDEESDTKVVNISVEDGDDVQIQLLQGLGVQIPRIYPLKTFNLNINEMTSREYSEDIYADTREHLTFYKDSCLINCFRESILKNRRLFRNKIVLDVGCGMGLLSLFAAQAGAQRVISVDCSVITQLTERIVKENHYSDVITVVKSRIEDLRVLPHGIEKVDIIISSWMGHCLYLDSAFNAVIYARRKFLKKGGLILPDKAELHCIAAYDKQAADTFFFWKNVYGFDMEPIQTDWSNIAYFHFVPNDRVMSNSVLVHSIDLNTCKISDSNFKKNVSFFSTKPGLINSLVFSFKVYFFGNQAVLDTSPTMPPTHYASTVLFIDRLLMVNNEAEFFCSLHFKRQQDRHNSIECSVSVDYYDFCFEKKYGLNFY